jgi:hypothetical protein
MAPYMRQVAAPNGLPAQSQFHHFAMSFFGGCIFFIGILCASILGLMLGAYAVELIGFAIPFVRQNMLRGNIEFTCQRHSTNATSTLAGSPIFEMAAQSLRDQDMFLFRHMWGWVDRFEIDYHVYPSDGRQGQLVPSILLCRDLFPFMQNMTLDPCERVSYDGVDVAHVRRFEALCKAARQLKIIWTIENDWEQISNTLLLSPPETLLQYIRETKKLAMGAGVSVPREFMEAFLWGPRAFWPLRVVLRVLDIITWDFVVPLLIEVSNSVRTILFIMLPKPPT